MIAHDLSALGGAARAAEPGRALLRCPRRDRDRVLAIQHQRVVNRDHTVEGEKRCWQIQKTPGRTTLAGGRVTVSEQRDGTRRSGYGPHRVGRDTAAAVPLQKQSRGRCRWACSIRPSAWNWSRNFRAGSGEGISGPIIAVSPASSR